MRTRVALLIGIALSGSLASCGGDSSSSSSTAAKPSVTSVFRTIPTTSTTLSDTGTTGAAGAPAPGPGSATPYIIVSGDYPLKVGKLFGCTWAEIAAYNDLDPSPNKFPIPGKSINIPVTCGGTSSTATATGTTVAGTPTTKATSTATTKPGATTTTKAGATTTTKPKSTTTTVAGAANAGSYTIAANDTLSGIATRFNTTIDAIVKLNGWTDGSKHLLTPGAKIKVPKPG